ncbi:MAG: hypothetical protein M3137_08365 [Actinomycetota bacterium]|nr:hypothetical protein [Actinomycetota bacterium]
MIETGWWTTCLQVLPPFERSLGRFQLYRSELAPGDAHDGLSDGDLEDSCPGRPVVALFGSALFPAGSGRSTRTPAGATSTPFPVWQAKRLVVEQVLAHAQADGRLPRSYGCVPQGDPDQTGTMRG